MCKYSAKRWYYRLLWEEQNGLCALCSLPVQLVKRKRDPFAGATLDHIIPKSKGGVSALENYQLTHAWCNTCRGNMNLSEWDPSKHLRPKPSNITQAQADRAEYKRQHRERIRLGLFSIKDIIEVEKPPIEERAFVGPGIALEIIGGFYKKI